MLTNDAGDGSRPPRGWFESILTRLGEGIVAVDRQGRVDFLNPAAEALTGWRGADAAGRPIDSVVWLVDEATRRRIENPVWGPQARRVTAAPSCPAYGCWSSTTTRRVAD